MKLKNKFMIIVLATGLYACGADETQSTSLTALSSETTTERTLQEIADSSQPAEFWDRDAKVAILNNCQNVIQDWEYTHRCACAVEEITKLTKADVLRNYGFDYINSDKVSQCVDQKRVIEGAE